MSSLVERGSKYSDEDRLRVAVEYVVTGNMTLVSKNTGIPRQTLVGWKKSEWWDDLIGKVRQEKGDELDAKFVKLLDSAFEQAQDRVENGDYRVSKDGKLIRVPMSGRDLVIAGATVYDKQRLHRNQPTAIKADSISMQELAEQFRQISEEHQAEIARECQRKMANSIDGECEEVK